MFFIRNPKKFQFIAKHKEDITRMKFDGGFYQPAIRDVIRKAGYFFADIKAGIGSSVLLFLSEKYCVHPR